MNTARIVFMGSPDFALPTLQALAETCQVVGVVTQPDRPAGRGKRLQPPPVKELAQRLGLPLIQPRRLQEPAAMQQLRHWRPDLIVVAAFGQILKPEVLKLPPNGCLNVHASLLPRWRGAAPIQAAILHGDEETGVTIMQMDAGLDTGPILAQRATPIQADDTAGTLFNRLATMGADLLIDTLPAWLAGKITPHPQDESLATYAPMLKKSDGLLDFTQPAAFLARKVRAFNPWPGAYLPYRNRPLRILKAQALTGQGAEYPAGTRLIWQKQPAIAAADGLLLLQEVQPAGKKAMSGKAFLAGARDWGDSQVVC